MESFLFLLGDLHQNADGLKGGEVEAISPAISFFTTRLVLLPSTELFSARRSLEITNEGKKLINVITGRQGDRNWTPRRSY